MFSNAQKLAAVLNKWAQPAIQGLLGGRLGQLPFIANIDAKVRSTGWVSPMWSISKEIAPVLNGLSSSLIEPMLAGGTSCGLPSCIYCVSISFPSSVIRIMLSHWAEGRPSSVHTVQPSASSMNTS